MLIRYIYEFEKKGLISYKFTIKEWIKRFKDDLTLEVKKDGKVNVLMTFNGRK